MTVILNLCLIIGTLVFSKSSVLKLFFFHTKTKRRRFREGFRKALFSWQISVDGRPNRRNKAALFRFLGVLWTLSWSSTLCSPQISLHRRAVNFKLDGTGGKRLKFLHAMMKPEWFSYLPSASTAQQLCPDHVFIYGFCVACRVLRLCTQTKQLSLLSDW